MASMIEVTSSRSRSDENPDIEYWNGHRDDAQVSVDVAETRLSPQEALPSHLREYWENALEVARRRHAYCVTQLGRIAGMSVQR